MGLGFGEAQGDVGGLGRRIDHPQLGPQKSPSNIKDQVRLSDNVTICNKDWE